MKRVALFLLFFLWTGTSVLAAGPVRIVSLAPQITEILYALGLEDSVAAVTTVCDYPPQVKDKPKIGGMSNPSLEAVLSIQPDLVVMTMDGNPKEFEEKLRSLGIRTYIFSSRRIKELPQGIKDLGKVVGAEKRAEALADEIERSLKNMKERFRGKRDTWKALFVVSPEPLIVAGPGTAIDDSITLLGGKNIAAGTGLPYPKYSIEEVLRQAPDVIFIGKGMGTMKDMTVVLLKKLHTVPAVKNDKVCFVGDYLYRLGPRTLKGVEELAQCLGQD